MSEYYEIPDRPQYQRDIEKLKNSDPASATKTFNPLLSQLVENIQAAKEAADSAKGTRSATCVIGTRNSGHTESDADYLCAGKNDHIVINQAIADLPGRGGKILLLEGEYHVAESVVLSKGYVTLQGMGASTVLLRTGHECVLRIDGPYCQVRNLKVDGNHADMPMEGDDNGIVTSSGAQYLLVERVHSVYSGGTGIFLGAGPAAIINSDFSNNEEGICFAPAYSDIGESVHIANCTCNSNRERGIALVSSPRNCVVYSCEAMRNVYGIAIEGSNSEAVRITSCTASNNAKNGILASGRYITITGNTVVENGSLGIDLYATESLLTNNVIYENSGGTYMDNGKYNIVANNGMYTSSAN